MTKKKKDLRLEIAPPVTGELTIAAPIELRRSPGNNRVLSAAFLGDFQRHYNEKGYKVFDWLFETHPLSYFNALVGLSKVVRIEADVTHRDGAKPQSIDEILDRVEAETGAGGRAAFAKFLDKVKPKTS